MKNPFKPILNFLADKFQKDASKMLIYTGVAGWTLSSLAQIGAILFNPKISKEQKSFLIPQEFADAVVNIGSFFVFTLSAKTLVSKLFSTGKWATASVRKKLEPFKDEIGTKIGKLDFNLDDFFKSKNITNLKEYYACKNLGTTFATVGAGIISSNIITPIVRNKMASSMQKNYIDYTNKKQVDVKKTELKKDDIKQPVFKSQGLRI